MNWIEKYRPKELSEIKGQEEIITKIKDFLKNFPKEKKAVILHGPAGIGKTSIAHALTEEFDLELFELNASDFRDKKRLREVLRPVIEQKSLSNKKKIVLIDEVDGISSADQGGLTELLSIVEQSKYPIIITANDVWNKKLSQLRKKVKLLQLKEIHYKIAKEVLKNILKKEEKVINEDILTKIALQTKGDLRAAINDLQTIIHLKDHTEIVFDERNKETDIFNALRIIFKESPREDLLRIFDSVEMPIDEIMLWLEENIPSEYTGVELKKAVENLSKADLFKGRIYKQQYWRFLVYENIFLSFGISSSKKNPKSGFTSYKRPSRILKIWINNQRNALKKSICKKYAEYVHVGEKRALSEFPIIKKIIKNPSTQKELKLSDEEIEYINSL